MMCEREYLNFHRKNGLGFLANFISNFLHRTNRHCLYFVVAAVVVVNVSHS